MDDSRRLKSWPGWLIATIVVLVLFNGLPFLAPVFMKLGWDLPGRAIYFAYGLMCHQMAQRSFFLFGPGGFQMYNIADLPVNLSGLHPTASMLALRQFWGKADIGWKVAWSDRMVYMYVAPLLVAVIYGFLRQRGPVKPLSIGMFLALLLPMALDGGSHWLSDIEGIGQGFRDSNLWLATLTNHVLPASFYAGDALGSFNSLMRLVSGVTFGIAIGGLLFPWIDIAAVKIEPVLLEKADANLTANEIGSSE
jgi:uncharacterized membrane protein